MKTDLVKCDGQLVIGDKSVHIIKWKEPIGTWQVLDDGSTDMSWEVLYLEVDPLFGTEIIMLLQEQYSAAQQIEFSGEYSQTYTLEFHDDVRTYTDARIMQINMELDDDLVALYQVKIRFGSTESSKYIESIKPQEAA